jgi:hypothetical protein
VIGGIALMTTDIDATVRGDATTPAALLEALARQAIAPRATNTLGAASPKNSAPREHTRIIQRFERPAPWVRAASHRGML